MSKLYIQDDHPTGHSLIRHGVGAAGSLIMVKMSSQIMG